MLDLGILQSGVDMAGVDKGGETWDFEQILRGRQRYLVSPGDKGGVDMLIYGYF